MHTTNELLNEIQQRAGGVTDYRVSKLLGTSTQTVQHWRKGHNIMSAAYAPKVAALLGWDAAYVMACLERERAARDPLEETGEIVSTWERIAERFKPAATIILIACALAGGVTKPAESQAFSLDRNFTVDGRVIHYAQLDEGRRRRRKRQKPKRRPGWWLTWLPIFGPNIAFA